MKKYLSYEKSTLLLMELELQFLSSYELNFTEHLRNLLLAHWLTQILPFLLVAASAC
jgi:hypothetical protein